MWFGQGGTRGRSCLSSIRPGSPRLLSQLSGQGEQRGTIWLKSCRTVVLLDEVLTLKVEEELPLVAGATGRPVLFPAHALF